MRWPPDHLPFGLSPQGLQPQQPPASSLPSHTINDLVAGRANGHVTPASYWPPCPPLHIAHSSFTEPPYPGMTPMLSSPQFLPPLPPPQEQTRWFQTLVAAVSKSIQDTGEKSVEVEIVDTERGKLSSKDETFKTLIDGLKKWKTGELQMPEVFEALSKTNGHTATQWKTWFISNFEALNSQLDLTSNIQQCPSVDVNHTTVPGSAITPLVNECARSRDHAGASVPPEKQASDQSLLQGSAPHHRLSGSPDSQRGVPQRRRRRRTSKDGKTASTWTRVRSRAGQLPAPVTPEDLRSMALHLFENGDTCEIRHYRAARWRAFAERPENRKRSLEGWASIPRLHPKYAAEIERYLKEFQNNATSTTAAEADPRTVSEVSPIRRSMVTDG